ncbi:hypothetical protein G7046_g2036 [Stylonectria norvegica]|nr:hypothetical protein G7046_g2036 [Stylonectria norvegica]
MDEGSGVVWESPCEWCGWVGRFDKLGSRQPGLPSSEDSTVVAASVDEGVASRAVLLVQQAAAGAVLAVIDEARSSRVEETGVRWLVGVPEWMIRDCLLQTYPTSTSPPSSLPPEAELQISDSDISAHPKVTDAVRKNATRTMAVDDLPSIALPGNVLGPLSKYAPGPGTHVYDGNVVSSLMGRVAVTAPVKPVGPAKRLNKLTAPVTEELAIVSVARHGHKREVLPDVNNVVLARVVRLMPKQAIVVIQQVGETVLQTEWQGVIRVQDVRATEKDKTKIYESFKPGDIVRAQVISLGDQANYYLSTASNELGVIMATSETGNDMLPISWKEYKDPETGISEPRKVAKPS